MKDKFLQFLHSKKFFGESPAEKKLDLKEGRETWVKRWS